MFSAPQELLWVLVAKGSDKNVVKIEYPSKREVKEMLRALSARGDIDKAFLEFLREREDDVKLGRTDRFEIVIFGDVPALFRLPDVDRYVPTLYALNSIYYSRGLLIVPSVVVDEGAVGPLKRGADVMIPGIRKVLKEFQKDEVVGVLDPTERYFIVVGLALASSSSIVPGARGKVIKNLSHLDDDLWRASLQLAQVFGRGRP